MEIVLIRHAQPEWAKDGLNVNDPPLTELGHRQAECLAATHHDLDPTEIAVSPMLRARQTAAPLLRVLGRDEVVEPWLEEVRDPNWHGTPFAIAVEAFAAEKQRPAEERWLGLDGGENVRDFVNRVDTGVGAWLESRGIRRVSGELPVWDIDDPERRIAFVAHGGTNGVIVCHLLGLTPTPWEWQRFVHQHASVSRFVANPVGQHFAFALTQLSGVEHLPHSMRTQ
jgi:2,3-bisphosphoglycerate-dependent phosphoglycerate mutase